MEIRGKVFKYGDNVDSDVLFPARYLTINDQKEMGAHALEDLDRDFVKLVEPGDVIVAGVYFGCGSQRDHAVMAMKEVGVGCVIAKSYARSFYRNCINIGLPLIECPEAAEGIEKGDRLEIDLSNGVIRNITSGVVYSIPPFPEYIQKIIDAGGIMEYTRKEYGEA